jgi:5-hydroxyisourate hydrolase-like protein (transthyretin family)
MGRTSLVLSILTATLPLFAQKPASAPNKPEEQVAASCTVSGRVVTAAEGSPLKSARVALVREHGGSSPRIYAAISDSDGHFTIKDVAPGRYDFLAVRTGYVDQPYQSNGTDRGAVLALQPGQHLADVLFRITMAAVITGHVNNEDGEAMARVRVTALRRPTEEETIEEELPTSQKLEPTPVSSAQTDDRGEYRIFGLKPGEYYVKATDSSEPEMNMPVGQYQFIREFLGSDYAPVFYPGVPRLGQAQPVPLSAGAEVQVDFAMRQVKTVEISGHVISPGGTPASDVSINLEEAQGEDYSSERYASTDTKGNFSLKGIPPGSYVLFAYQRVQGEKPYSARQKLEVGNDNIDSVTLVLGGGMNFSGRLTIAGPGSVRRDRIFIRLIPVGEGTSWGNAGDVKKDGTFEIADVKEGSYAVSIRGPEEGWYTKSVRLGADDVLANGLQVEKGSSGGTLEIVVSTGTALLEGSVSEDDKPAIGARVHLTVDPETPYNRMRSRTVSTDQNGHFSLQIAPGKYQVVAKSRSLTGGGAATSDPRTVNVSEHDRKTIQLTIAPETGE